MLGVGSWISHLVIASVVTYASNTQLQSCINDPVHCTALVVFLCLKHENLIIGFEGKYLGMNSSQRRVSLCEYENLSS